MGKDEFLDELVEDMVVNDENLTNNDGETVEVSKLAEDLMENITGEKLWVE